ncbi:MAG: PAN domain-containing protein [Sulfurovaceae bacterium]
MKKIIRITALLVSIGTSMVFAREMEIDTDRLGGDYRVITDISTALECQEMCDSEEPCKSWTFVIPGTIQGPEPHCYLKSIIPERRINTACISGISALSIDEVREIVRENVQMKLFKSSGKDFRAGVTSHLIRIAEALKDSEGSKLTIIVRGKAGGLANRRVDKLKDFFRAYDVPASKYDIHRQPGGGYFYVSSEAGPLNYHTNQVIIFVHHLR